MYVCVHYNKEKDWDKTKQVEPYVYSAEKLENGKCSGEVFIAFFDDLKQLVKWMSSVTKAVWKKSGGRQLVTMI